MIVRATWLRWMLSVAAFCIARNLGAEEVRIDLKGIQTPAVVGVPFEKGELRNASAVQLADRHGKKVPFESWIASTWSDGSIRGLALELGEKVGPGPLTLRYTPKTTGPARENLSIARSVGVVKPGTRGIAEDLGNHVFVRTGRLQVLIRGQNWKVITPKFRRRYDRLVNARGLPESFHKRFKLNPTPGGIKQWTKNRPIQPMYPCPHALLDMAWIDVNKDGNLSDEEKVLSDEALPGLVLKDASDRYWLSVRSRARRVRLVENTPQRCVLEASGAMTLLHPTGHAYRDHKKLGYQSWNTTSWQEPDEAWFVWTARLTFRKGSSKVMSNVMVERGGHRWRYSEFGRRQLSGLVPIKELSVEFKPTACALPIKPRPTADLAPLSAAQQADGLAGAFLWKATDGKCLAAGEGFALSRVFELEFKPKGDK